MKKKKIIIGIMILLIAYAGITYYSWLENKNRNIQNMITPKVPLPKVLFATVEGANFDHNIFRSNADILISNPSNIAYANINVAVIGLDKDGIATKTEQVLFEQVAPYTKYSKQISFPPRVRSITCQIIKFE